MEDTSRLAPPQVMVAVVEYSRHHSEQGVYIAIWMPKAFLSRLRDGSLRDAIVNTNDKFTMSTAGMTRSSAVWTVNCLRWFSISMSGCTKPSAFWASFIRLKILTLTDDDGLLVTATIFATKLSRSFSNGEVLGLLPTRRTNVPGRRSALSVCE